MPVNCPADDAGNPPYKHNHPVGWIREAIHQPGAAGQAVPVMFRAGIKRWWIASIIRRWVYGLMPVNCPTDDAGNPPYCYIYRRMLYKDFGVLQGVVMSNYRRHYVAGGSYFFTVNLYNRKQILLTDHIDLLRDSVRKVKKKYPFEIVAWVVLPDHMHCIWTLPEGCSDFSIRWRLIKLQFSKGVAISASSTVNHRRERQIWQRRFWEHTLRDAYDMQRHVDYIHYNPVKHGYVSNVQEWPYSSIHWR